MLKVVVIGLGYVGLPLAIESAKAGYSTIGLDIDLNRINNLNLGISYLEDIENISLKEQASSGKFRASQDFSEIEQADVVVICVPTPLLNNHKPDLSAVKSAANSIAKYLTEGQLVILESTVEPETTRKFLVPLLEKGSGLKREEFDVVFSPERIDPTNKKWTLKNTPKIVAGLTNKASARAVDFYSKFIDNVIVVDSLEVAETAKLLENSFRLVNISFINEISIFCQKLGIDVNEVIAAAATKPYGFMPFYPSIGVGGHCIPVDPLYLANKAREVGASTRFIDLADQINQEMPGYFVGRAEEKLGGLKTKKVLVVGVSYKPNVADVRETPVESLIIGLKQKGAQVSWHDDLVKEWNGEKSVTLSSNFDLAIIATPHDYLDLTKLGNVPILNTRGSI
jgi:UDP-N-acetyl-D-glucosamine dehydrogenase